MWCRSSWTSEPFTPVRPNLVFPLLIELLGLSSELSGISQANRSYVPTQLPNPQNTLFHHRELSKDILMKLPSAQQVLRDFGGTFRRFPFVIVDATLGTLAAILLIDHEGPPSATFLFNVLFAAILGIPLLIATALVAEKKKWNRTISLGANLTCLLFLIAYAFTVPSDLSVAPNIHMLRLLILSTALHLFVAIAPFSGPREINGFWQFNKTLFIRILTALLFTVVLYAGLALAMAALDHLFGMNIPGKRYPELWILLVGMFTTWFFLAGIPENLDGLDASTEYPRFVKVFVQYILFPLVLVYLVILYAYVGKILLSWNWPQGWVSKLILGFASTGLFSILLLYPIRNQVENVWIRSASSWFYIILIPLIVMLPFAVWRRISQYGVTEGRYLALVLALWLAIIAVYFIFSKTKNIKFIPASLCLFSFLVSFGPGGAFSVSESSQVRRLSELLAKNSILVDGKIQKTQSKIPFEDTKQISSILGYLHEIHGFGRIQPWFNDNLKNDSQSLPSEYKGPAVVAKMMGIEYVMIWQFAGSNTYVLSADPDGVINTEGYNRLIQAQHINPARIRKDILTHQVSYRVTSGLDTLIFTSLRDGIATDSLRIDLRQLVEGLLKDYGTASTGNIPIEKMSITAANNAMKLKIYLRHIQVRRETDQTEFLFYDAEILYALTN